ncbi:hypothetical protein G6F56_008040 [Rhizopus delemar]|nr:hypothetical protein G6F56_008040 [Rhizopus delemar]
MASQLFRTSLRAFARSSVIKSAVAPRITPRVVPAFQAARSFSTTFVRMGTGAVISFINLTKNFNTKRQMKKKNLNLSRPF